MLIRDVFGGSPPTPSFNGRGSKVPVQNGPSLNPTRKGNPTRRSLSLSKGCPDGGGGRGLIKRSAECLMMDMVRGRSTHFNDWM